MLDGCLIFKALPGNLVIKIEVYDPSVLQKQFRIAIASSKCEKHGFGIKYV